MGSMKLAFSPREVAEALGVTSNTVYSKIYEGEINTIRVGRAYRITANELERLGWPIPKVVASA